MKDEDLGEVQSYKEREMHRRSECRRQEEIWRRRICGEREENEQRREGEVVNWIEMLLGLKFEPN